MLIVGRDLLFEYMRKHGDAEGALYSWIDEVERADWQSPQDIKLRYRTASFLKNNVVIFNIKGNHHRLVVKVTYENGVVRIKWVGTHAEYDKNKF